MAKVSVRQWRFLGPTGPVTAGRGYTLRNQTHRRSVRYRRRKYGINLVWDDSAALRNVVLERRSGARGPILFGEPLALRVTGGGRYVRYLRRDNGINLAWSGRAIEQWEVTGGVVGTPVATNRTVGLFNRRHGDHVVYGRRSRGINLRWWSDLDIFRDYPPLPIPHAFRSPSGEPGQIELTGTATKVSLFHGGTDDELDWHVFIRLSANDRRRLFRHLSQHTTIPPADSFSGFKPPTEASLERMVCEWMVLDGWDNSFTDEKFFSADVTRALSLRRSAWDASVAAARKQGISGASVDETNRSALCTRSARVSLQGAFVNDAGHRYKVEIHPLDSIAYALASESVRDEGDGPLVREEPLGVGPGEPGWPTGRVTWRVAAFSNSAFHRINGADYIKKTRVTRWYLPLPSNSLRGGFRTSLSASFPRFTNEGRGRGGLDDRRPTASDLYRDYGVARHSSRIEVDPRDGVRKLRVEVAMRAPSDRWGGMFLGEYTLRALPVLAPRPGGTQGTRSTKRKTKLVRRGVVFKK